MPPLSGLKSISFWYIISKCLICTPKVTQNNFDKKGLWVEKFKESWHKQFRGWQTGKEGARRRGVGSGIERDLQVVGMSIITLRWWCQACAQGSNWWKHTLSAFVTCALHSPGLKVSITSAACSTARLAGELDFRTCLILWPAEQTSLHKNLSYSNYWVWRMLEVC